MWQQLATALFFHVLLFFLLFSTLCAEELILLVLHLNQTEL